MANSLPFPKARFVNIMREQLELAKKGSSARQLKRINLLLEIVNKLPDEFFSNMRMVYATHYDPLRRMGYDDLDAFFKAPWLIRFYRWQLKTEKFQGQKAHLGGKLLEEIVKNDKDLHASLEKFVLKRHQELRQTNFAALFADTNMNTSGFRIQDIENFEVVKAVDLVSGGKMFLDFAYLLYNKNTNKVIVVVEGQVKREGAVAGYIEQARKDIDRFYTAGFEFMYNGKQVKVAPNEIMIDELNGSKILVRSDSNIQIGKRSFYRMGMPLVSLKAFNAESYHVFVVPESQDAVNKLLNSLFDAKMKWSKKDWMQ